MSTGKQNIDRTDAGCVVGEGGDGPVSVLDVWQNGQFTSYDGPDDKPLIASLRQSCPECEGSVVGHQRQLLCAACGLIVDERFVERGPSRKAHGPDEWSRRDEWSCETTSAFRADKGLTTTFFLGSDGYGRSLSQKERDKWGRLRRMNKRYQLRKTTRKRQQEGLRDVEMIGEELALPRHVLEAAARYLKRAGEAELPGGHMAWESLAAGAVLVAARKHTDREHLDLDAAQYAKSPRERVCAAARKIRVELDLDVPPIRPNAVDAVLTELEDTLDAPAILELSPVAKRLMALADDEKIGPGTPRLSVAAAAIYAADRVTSGKELTYDDVVDATGNLIETSTKRVEPYAREIIRAAEQDGL